MKNVLIIDDSEVNLFLIESMFKDDPDYHVEVEIDSKKAIKTIRQMKPDLLILDLMMPGLDGHTLLQQIKAESDIASIPVIILSAKQEQESVDKAIEYGANEYLKKPVEYETIRSMMGKYA